MTDTTSLAVWDVPMPVVAGGRFAIKVGAKAASGRAPAGGRVEVSDAAGAVVASGTLGDTPWPGTQALYWVALDVPAPAQSGVSEYSVRLEAATSRFSVAAAGRPEHRLGITVTEEHSAKPLDGVEIRLGPFRARTDKAGHAELRVAAGEHRLHLWRHTHDAKPQTIAIASDADIGVEMRHVPEDHPDVRWVG